MVLRRDGAGVLAVGQASHAWLCGQLARAWGNERFGAVEPLDEVALGAEQHDVGMARWDLEPARHPETGLPKSFMEMGAQANAGLWSRGPQRLVTQSRYAALLAIMHGRRLYEGFDTHGASAADAEAVTAFLRHAAELAGSLLEALRADPVAAAHATPDRVARNSQLLWTWDLISLALLLDWAPQTLEAVPTAGGGAMDVALEAVPDAGSPDPVHSLDPWPFAAPEVRVHCEGRRLTEGSRDAEALAGGLARARWETVEFTLVPGAELRQGL
ncbi:MAG TPA: DUF3891 family protein [Solirubrobacteraceae bacterium]|nr:DUF3891 family protein [Solirubrobacteraceae bacterium]